MNDEQVHKFLEELSEVSRKYGVQISGCGCCGSPYLWDMDSRNGHYSVDTTRPYQGAYVSLGWTDATAYIVRGDEDEVQ